MTETESKLQYLMRRLSEVSAEVRAETGLSVGVEFNIHVSQEHTPDLANAAESMGWGRHEWSKYTQGGYWLHELGEIGCNVIIHDENMPHLKAVQQ